MALSFRSDLRLYSCLRLNPSLRLCSKLIIPATLRAFAILFVIGLTSCVQVEVGSNNQQINRSAPIVFAGQEKLAGKWSSTRPGQAQFFGIPFAAPPTKENRFRPPLPHTPRQGLQQSTEFGSACIQEQGNPDWYRMVAKGVGVDGDIIPDLEQISEDCLTLNIWTENPKGDTKLPVLVWIYGGGNRNGYSHEPNYQGYNVASKGVVFVSINYRVGALGFMSHPDLTAESIHKSSGNYAILDQIAALKWIQDNIAAFGGDPSAVTISGESAGAGNAANLIASPLAKGMFRGAILQSGAMRMSFRPNLTDNEQVGVNLAKALGINSLDDDVKERLREIPALEIIETQRKVIKSYNNVVEDGWVLPGSARSIVEAGKHNPVNILTGTNAQEWLMYYPVNSGEKEYQSALDFFAGSKKMEIQNILDATGLGPKEKRDLLSSGHGFHCPALKLAGEIDRHGGKAFVYNFSRVRPGAQALMAYHGAEIPYAFDTADNWLPANKTDAMLTQAMLDYWTNFVKTGDPNSAELIYWPRYDNNGQNYLELGDRIVAGTQLRREFCSLMNSVWDEKLQEQLNKSRNNQ